MRKLAVLLLMVSMTALGAQSTSVLEDAYKSLRASNFSSNWIFVNEQIKNQAEVDGYYSEIDAYFNYRLSKQDEITLLPILTYSNPDSADSQTTLEVVEFSYRRTNLLKEKLAGFDFHFKTAYSSYVDDNVRNASGTYGSYQLRLEATRSLSSNSSLYLGLRQYYKFRQSSTQESVKRMRAVDTVNRYSTILDIVPALQVSQKVDINALIRVGLNVPFGDANDTTQSLRLVPALGYKLSPRMNASLYLDTTPYVATNNNWRHRGNFIDEGKYGIELAASLF